MPELTEVTNSHPEEEAHDGDSATDSEDDNDSIPELEETSGQKEEVDPVAAAAGARAAGARATGARAAEAPTGAGATGAAATGAGETA